MKIGKAAELDDLVVFPALGGNEAKRRDGLLNDVLIHSLQIMNTVELKI